MAVASMRKAALGQAVIESVFSILITVILFMFIAALCVFLYLQTTVFMAARHGARLAAVSSLMATNPASVTTTVRSGVQSYFIGVTGGRVIPSGNITLTGPTGTVGARTVTVRVTYTVTDGIPVGALLQTLGVSAATAADIDSFDCAATATMRYEE